MFNILNMTIYAATMKISRNYPRPFYLNALWSWKDSQEIKVVVGPRRSGKSTLFELYQDKLRENGVSDDHIISFNLESPRLNLTDSEKLFAAVMARVKDEDPYYVFIDEVQECKQFEKAVNGLALEKNLDIYITGSNAHLLSGELSTFLSGRFIAIEMMPLSFAEFRSAVLEDSLSSEDDFNRYLQIGSFPALIDFRDNSLKINNYYSSLLSTVFDKDIRSRHSLRNEEALQRVARAIASSVGSAVSARRITNTLKSAGFEVSNTTVTSYLEWLCEAYYCYRVPRFDIRGNAALSTEEKFYLCDTGFRQYLINSSTSDLGHLIENIVFLELKRRYGTVSVGKTGEREVDFVVKRGQDIAYFQVSLSVLDDATLQRELAPLEAIRDNQPKFLLTLDTIGKNRNLNGIRQLNLIEWLLNVPI